MIRAIVWAAYCKLHIIYSIFNVTEPLNEGDLDLTRYKLKMT